MGTFKYRAKESSGNTLEGIIEAETSDEAAEKVNRLGYFPIKIEEALAGAKQAVEAVSGPEGPSVPFRKISSKENMNSWRF